MVLIYYSPDKFKLKEPADLKTLIPPVGFMFTDDCFLASDNVWIGPGAKTEILDAWSYVN